MTGPPWVFSRIGRTPAQEQARAVGHTGVGTRHLLLGLLAHAEAGGPVPSVLKQHGTSTGAVIAATRSALPGPGAADPPPLIPYDEPVRKCPELSFREALRLEHGFVGVEHMLLALLELEDDGGPLRSVGLTRAGAEPGIVALVEATLEDD